MKRTIIALFILVFSKNIAFSQESFTLKIQEVPENIERSKTQKIIYALSLESKDIENELFKDYTISVKPDCNTGTLSQTEFILDFKDCTLDELSDEGYPFYLTILPNPNLDKERTIKLDIAITSSKDPKLEKIKYNADETSQIITLKPIDLDTALDQYNYLAYIGTNFDLVDGVKAKNLFFAANIYKLPETTKDGEPRDLGFNLMIYGNRALTLTEELGSDNFDYKYVRIQGTENSRVFTKEGDLSRSIVSDNLGLVVSPIFNWFNSEKIQRTLKINYSPQLEFAFRRYTQTETYSNVTEGDSSRIITYRGSDLVNLNRENRTTFNNSYDLDIGLLGFFFTHETNHISVRFHLNSGYSLRFSKGRISSSMSHELFNPIKGHGNFFYGARLWITEAISGVTLAGEVANRLIIGDNQPFFNVTLSKAISFQSIGSIFSPITAR